LALDESRRRQSVQSVIKALRILALFDAEHRDWKVGDIAKVTGYDRTTVHRIVQTMEGERVLARNGEGGSYELGGGLASLLFTLDPCEQMRVLVRPYLQSLADLTGETSVLGIGCNLDTLILDFVLTRNAFKPLITHGRRWTGLANAHAKVFFAFSSVDRRTKMLQAIRLKATPEVLSQAEAFETELDQILSAGVAMDYGGQTPGVRVVVGPVFSSGSDVVRVGLGVTVPPERGSCEEMIRLAGITRQVCDQVSAEMGPDLYALLRQIRDDLL
jgi:DNA-binding IclR family transcriptional regulator